MEAATVWSLVTAAPWWQAGALGLLAAAGAAVLLLRLARRRDTAFAYDDSTLDDDAPGGFRSSRFAARVCGACSQPMLLEGDGRWRCAAYPVCRS